MRHRKAGRKLNRTGEHRLAMMRNMAISLVMNGRVITTREKAKTVQPFIEKLVTLAKRPDNRLHNYRRAIAILGNYAGKVPIDSRDIAARGTSKSRQYKGSRIKFRKGHPSYRLTLPKPRRRVDVKFIKDTRNASETAAKKLFEEIAPRYATRPGGYTRILRISKNRLGDNASQALFEFVGEEDSRSKKSAPGRRAKPLGRKPAKETHAKSTLAEEAPAEDVPAKEVPAPITPEEERTASLDEVADALETAVIPEDASSRDAVSDGGAPDGATPESPAEPKSPEAESGAKPAGG